MLIETIYICISYICLYEQTSSHVYIILDASQTKGSFFYRKLMYFSSLLFAYFILILLNFIAIYLTTSFFLVNLFRIHTSAYLIHIQSSQSHSKCLSSFCCDDAGEIDRSLLIPLSISFRFFILLYCLKLYFIYLRTQQQY